MSRRESSGAICAVRRYEATSRRSRMWSQSKERGRRFEASAGEAGQGGPARRAKSQPAARSNEIAPRVPAPPPGHRASRDLIKRSASSDARLARCRTQCPPLVSSTSCSRTAWRRPKGRVQGSEADTSASLRCTGTFSLLCVGRSCAVPFVARGRAGAGRRGPSARPMPLGRERASAWFGSRGLDSRLLDPASWPTGLQRASSRR